MGEGDGSAVGVATGEAAGEAGPVEHRARCCGIIADQSNEELTAVAADRRLTRVLAVKTGSPLLRRTRTVFDTRRQPMEYSIVHYRGDRFELSLTLRQQ